MTSVVKLKQISDVRKTQSSYENRCSSGLNVDDNMANYAEKFADKLAIGECSIPYPETLLTMQLDKIWVVQKDYLPFRKSS